MTKSNSTTKAATKTATAKADKPAAPVLAKAKQDTLRGILAHFTGAEQDALKSADAQRLDIIAMVDVGPFDACWPIISEALGALWAETTVKVSKSQFSLYWRAKAAGVAFPTPDAPIGWQRYAKGALSDAMREAGQMQERAPRAGGKAPGKVAASDATAAQAVTVAKGTDTLADVLAAMAELANRAAVLAGDSRASLAIIAAVRDDIQALQALAK